MNNANDILEQYFGYDSFRDGQKQLIDSILTGKDCLGVMPTGAGKSVCFQVPAIMSEGVTIVISPLISLMKDQVNALTQVGAKAAFINSSLTEAQIKLVLSRAESGEYKIIYVAPERLLESGFLRYATKANIFMVTVDEAHCISQWGQDFRPSYVKIADFINKLAKRPVVSAFTATATPQVCEDIIQLLGFKKPIVLVTGFNRENLYFSVRKPKDKFAALIEYIESNSDKCGIVYCSTRNTVEEVYLGLNREGYSVSKYHAGLSDKERRDNQDDFIYDRAQIMVATNAFGMGIDKSNVKFVIHYNMPKDIESYYQEAGRAGRDGENADCILFYNGQDVRINMFLIENNKDVTYTDSETEKRLKERDRQRLRTMTFYCHTSDCLRGYILKYFGERLGNNCDNCNNCKVNFEKIDVTIDAQKILSCVKRVGERFGVKMIIDILRGNKNERLMRLAFDKLSTYNISVLSEKRLRDIINHLVLNDYLIITDDQYPVLKLGLKASKLLKENVTIEMKLIKEEEMLVKSGSKPIKTISLNKELFEKLRRLRSEIASEQKVPTFVIFSDSTLTDMCIKMPSGPNEMLKVLGVGQLKLQRYGERFLDAIKEFVSEKGEVHDEVDDSKKGINMTSQADIEVSDDPVTISVIADRINCFLMQKALKRLTGAKINDWLVSKGYIDVISHDNSKSKVPSARGVELGITAEE